jgi:hypothetical protein
MVKMRAINLTDCPTKQDLAPATIIRMADAAMVEAAINLINRRGLSVAMECSHKRVKVDAVPTSKISTKIIRMFKTTIQVRRDLEMTLTTAATTLIRATTVTHNRIRRQQLGSPSTGKARLIFGLS